jgi:hypothetical protein
MAVLGWEGWRSVHLFCELSHGSIADKLVEQFVFLLYCYHTKSYLQTYSFAEDSSTMPRPTLLL